jgi:hypothetical protein
MMMEPYSSRRLFGVSFEEISSISFQSRLYTCLCSFWCLEDEQPVPMFAVLRFLAVELDLQTFLSDLIRVCGRPEDLRKVMKSEMGYGWQGEEDRQETSSGCHWLSQ